MKRYAKYLIQSRILLGVAVLSLFAIFYGLKALAKIKYDEETYDGRGLAVVGIALGIIFIAIWCFLFVSFQHLSF